MTLSDASILSIVGQIEISSDDAVKVIAALRDSVRPLVLERFTEDSCVATTRITIDALSYFGVEAKPAAVETLIFNAEAAALVEAGATPEELRAALFSHSPINGGGPWTVGLGVANEAGEGGRHMLTWLPALDICLDFSLDQASRPHKGMLLGPEVIRLPEAPEAGGSVAEGGTDRLPLDFLFSWSVSQPPPYGPTRLDYRVVEDWFRVSPNWRRTSLHIPGAPNAFREITGKVIRRIRESL